LTPVADILEVILKSLTDRIALAVLFIALIFIGFAKLLPADSSLGQWSQAHLIMWYVTAIAALCYLPTRHIIEAADGYVADRKNQSRLGKRLKQLESLGSDDRFLLYNPIKAQQMAFRVNINAVHIAKSLEKRGIIFETDAENPWDGKSFTFDKDSFDYLIEHPNLVGITKGS
jgi:hypothetical protein